MSSSSLTFRPAPVVQGRPAARRALACSCSAARPNSEAPASRRVALGGSLLTAAALLLAERPAQARWDGESSAYGSCPFGDAGDECRASVIARDKLGNYADAANNSAKRGAAAGNVPVAEMGDAYSKDTAALAAAILAYAAADLYDPVRVELIKRLKPEGAQWAARYAPGGSARKLSARRMYVAVDALTGHLASNGFAPFPPTKLAKLVGDVEQARALLAEGK